MTGLPSIEDTLREIVELLVGGDYAGLERRTNGVRLSAKEMESAIVDYGRTLVFPPADAFLDIDVIPVRSSSPPSYSVRFTLYTHEEGRSDLELQATLGEGTEETRMSVEIDNILVA